MTATSRPARSFTDMKLTEAMIQRQIIEALRWAGHCVIVLNHTAQAKRAQRGTTKGASDLIVIQRGTGRCVALECKKLGGKLSPEQAEFRDAVLNAGGCYAVVTSPAEAMLALEERRPQP